MANQPLAVTAGMRRISRRFERWREAHKPRTPFPESSGVWSPSHRQGFAFGVWQTETGNGSRRVQRPTSRATTSAPGAGARDVFRTAPAARDVLWVGPLGVSH